VVQLELEHGAVAARAHDPRAHDHDPAKGKPRLDVERGLREDPVRPLTSISSVWMPGPRSSGGCDGSVFQFELTTPVPKVELLLMTVSGRRVASAQWPGKAGFNVYCWDGRDSRATLQPPVSTSTGSPAGRRGGGTRLRQSGRMIRTR